MTVQNVESAQVKQGSDPGGPVSGVWLKSYNLETHFSLPGKPIWGKVPDTDTPIPLPA